MTEGLRRSVSATKVTLDETLSTVRVACAVVPSVHLGIGSWALAVGRSQ